MDKKLLVVFFFWGFAYSAAGQKGYPINTDRPDQSDGTYTLPKNYYQLETGVLYGRESDDYFYHNIMLRYGLSSKTELQLLLDYGTRNTETGIMPAGLSVKQQLLSQKSPLPDITAVVNLRFQFLATNNFKPDKLPVDFLLAFENELSDQFSAGYNFGLSFDGESTRNDWVLTTSVSWAPVKEVAFFSEYFSRFSGISSPDHNIDAGILWLLKNNLQLDIGVGSTIFKDRKNQFITMGVSYRFKE